MTRDTAARSAQWRHSDLTLDDALSAEPGAMLRRPAADLPPARKTTARLAIQHAAKQLAQSAGLVAIAATVTMTMAFATDCTATAATRPAAVAGEASIAAHSAGLKPGRALPTDQHLDVRTAPRPTLRDLGASTASVATGDAARTDRAAIAANPAAFERASDARIGAGFAQPKSVGKSIGRLAEELPAARPAAGTRYAALGKPRKSAGKSYSSSRLSGNISTGGKSTSCLPSDLKRALNEAAAKFGHIRISSTHRSHKHNRRVGGAPRSLHLQCRAVDFAFRGPRRGALIKFLRNHRAIGGLGVYGGSGHIHIDDGPHRSW